MRSRTPRSWPRRRSWRRCRGMVAGARSSAAGSAAGGPRTSGGTRHQPQMSGHEKTTPSDTATTMMVSISTSLSGTPRSSASSPKTIEASPRGPNQPMNATVGLIARRPAMAISQSTIRTIRPSAGEDHLPGDGAGSAKREVRALRPIEVIAATNPPASSANTRDHRAARARDPPERHGANCMPATKSAATQPQRDGVGQQRDRAGERSPPLAADHRRRSGEVEHSDRGYRRRGRQRPSRSGRRRC